MLNTRKSLRQIGIPSDNATTVAEYTDDTAMFPMGNPFLIGQFKLTKNIPTLRFGFRLMLHVGNEAWPRATLQLIQQGRFMLCHDFLL